MGQMINELKLHQLIVDHKISHGNHMKLQTCAHYEIWVATYYYQDSSINIFVAGGIF